MISSDQLKIGGIQRKNNDVHLKTGFEDDPRCICERALCGGVFYSAIHSQCIIHGSRNSPTFIEHHLAQDCYGFVIDYDSYGE